MLGSRQLPPASGSWGCIAGFKRSLHAYIAGGATHCLLCWASAQGFPGPSACANVHAVHDERHLVFECPAMQCVRYQHPTLFSPAKNTMQLFMWQHDIVGWHTTSRIVSSCLVP